MRNCVPRVQIREIQFGPNAFGFGPLIGAHKNRFTIVRIRSEMVVRAQYWFGSGEKTVELKSECDQPERSELQLPAAAATATATATTPNRPKGPKTKWMWVARRMKENCCMAKCENQMCVM